MSTGYMSSSAREAFSDMMKNGTRYRLPHWPDGQYLRYLKATDDIAIFRDHALSGLHHSPSGSEINDDRWEKYTVPEGVTEVDTLR
jgi:hypothetical protein